MQSNTLSSQHLKKVVFKASQVSDVGGNWQDNPIDLGDHDKPLILD